MKLRVRRLLTYIAVIVLPMGYQSQMSHETTTARNYLTWLGIRVSPFFPRDTELSKWIKRDLAFHPPSETWTQTTFGPWWLQGNIGTPPGNWFLIRPFHDRFVAAKSDHQKQEICDFAKRFLTASTQKEKDEIFEVAEERWRTR